MGVIVPVSYGPNLPASALDAIIGVLEQLEGYQDLQKKELPGQIYADSQNHPTIGYGFDLTQSNVLGAVLDALQGSFTVNGVTSTGNVFSAVAAFANALNPPVSVATTQIVSYFSWIVGQYGQNASVNSIAQLQAQLNTALQDFFTGARPDLNLTATGQPQLPTSPPAANSVAFEFDQTDTSAAQQVLSELITGAQIPEATRGTLNVVGFSPQLYTAFVNNSAPINSPDQSLIGAAPDSQQWIALVIAAYNGFPTGAGAGLRGGDPAETWYRLRYTNNIPITTGVAARNYIESAIFGLNGGASSVTEALALQDYETLTEHRPSIISFEQQFGARASGEHA